MSEKTHSIQTQVMPSEILNSGAGLGSPDFSTTRNTAPFVSPEDEQTYRASQAFKAHVESVTIEGDPLDMLSDFSWRALAARAIIPISIFSELAVSNGSNFITTGLAGLTVCIPGFLALRNRHDKDRKQATDVYNMETQKLVGERYELWRPSFLGRRAGKIPDPEIVWYGPINEDTHKGTALTHLRDTAQLAKDQNIPYMYAAYDMVAGISKLPNDSNSVYAHKMLRTIKTLASNVEDLGPWRFAYGSPEEWLKVANEVLVGKQDDQLQSVVPKLKEIRPEHPLVSLVEKYKDKPEILHEKLLVNSKAALELHLQKEEAYEDEDYREARRTPPPVARKEDGTIIEDSEVGGVYQKRARYLEKGFIKDDGETVIWQTREGPKLKSLIESLGLTDKRFAELTLAPRQDPSMAERALELAIFRIARKLAVKVALVEGTKESETKPVFRLAETLQQRLIKDSKGENLYRQAYIQLTSALVLTGIAIFGVSQIHDTINSYRSTAVQSARDTLARKQHVEPDFISDKAALTFAESRDSQLRDWDRLQNAERTIRIPNPHFNSKPPIVPASAGVGGGLENVGNVDFGTSTDQTIFTVTKHGNISSAGYWAMSTASVLEFSNGNMNWIENTQDWQGAQLSLPTTVPPQNTKWLEVERDLQPSDGLGVNFSTPTEYKLLKGHGGELNVPILEGDSLMAASINGKPVKVISRTDNTFGIEKLDDSPLSGHLRYWIAPFKGVPLPAFSQQLQIIGSNESVDAYDPYVPDAAILRSAVKDHILSAKTYNDTVTWGYPKIAGLLDTDIKNYWKYSYTPFPKNQQFFNAYDFVAKALKQRTDNCNVANTAVIVSGDNNSDAVFGYHVPDNANLTSHTLHEWRTDGDATSIAISSDKTTESGISNNNIELGLGIMLGALTLASQKRRITRVIHSGKAANQHRHHKKLAALTVEQANMAKAAASYQRYSGSSELDQAAVQHLANSLTVRTRVDASAADIFARRPDLYTRTVMKALRSQIHSNVSLSASFRTDLQEGIKTLKVARRAYPAPKTSRLKRTAAIIAQLRKKL